MRAPNGVQQLAIVIFLPAQQRPDEQEGQGRATICGTPP
jgi:hypothetical protein